MLSWIAAVILVLVLALILTQFRPSGTREITNGVYAVNCGMVNFYAITTSDGIVLFDTGINPALAERGLRKLGLSPQNVRHVFLTHTDFDHTGGLSAFPSAAVYISKAEEQMINGTTPRRGFMHNKLHTKYRALEDGETLTIGGASITARLAPGHTPGSTVYIVNGNIMVSGDLMRKTQTGATKPFFWLMNKDHGRNVRSVENMRAFADTADYVLTGHSGVIERAAG